MSDGDQVLNKNVIEFEVGIQRSRQDQPAFSQDGPSLPVFPETVLCMEICASERPIDLTMFSQWVLTDPGATLQIMRRNLIARSLPQERFERIEDYISALGIHACMEAVCHTLGKATSSPSVRLAWTHARRVAEKARGIAEETPAITHPEQAYLVGLLHELGSMPALLEWDKPFVQPNNTASIGLQLAELWCLPNCVKEYFVGLLRQDDSCPFTQIVDRAHQQLDRRVCFA